MLFGNELFETTTSTNSDAQLLEYFIVDELRDTLSVEELADFARSEECKELINAGLITEASLVFLDRSGDLQKRTSLAAIQFAKDRGDSLVKKLAFHTKKKKQLLAQIKQKYSMLAMKSAKKAQRELIKVDPRRFKRKIKIY